MMYNKDDEKFLRHLQALLSQDRQEAGLTIPTLEKRAKEAKQQRQQSQKPKTK
jgi:hypothetical protein